MKTARSPAWTNGRLEMPGRSRHDVRMLAREVDQRIWRSVDVSAIGRLMS